MDLPTTRASLTMGPRVMRRKQIDRVEQGWLRTARRWKNKHAASCLNPWQHRTDPATWQYKHSGRPTGLTSTCQVVSNTSRWTSPGDRDRHKRRLRNHEGVPLEVAYRMVQWARPELTLSFQLLAGSGEANTRRPVRTGLLGTTGVAKPEFCNNTAQSLDDAYSRFCCTSLLRDTKGNYPKPPLVITEISLFQSLELRHVSGNQNHPLCN